MSESEFPIETYRLAMSACAFCEPSFMVSSRYSNEVPRRESEFPPTEEMNASC